MPADILEGAASGVVAQPAKQLPPELLALLSGHSGVTDLLKGGGTTMQTTPTNPVEPARLQIPGDPGQAIPQGSFNSTGERKRAEAGAALHSIANITKGASDYIHQKKVRGMQMDTEKVMSAMEGLKEAQASGNQDAIKQNQQVINDLFSDPKKVKMFEKAFNIPLVGENKNKNSPEYQGMMAAARKWQSDNAKGQAQGMNPIAQKFMQGQPSRQGMDPRLAMQAQLTKAGVLPTANATTEAQSRIFTAVSRSMDNENTVAGRQQVAQMLVEAKDAASKSAIMKQIIANDGKKAAAEVMGRYRLESVRKQGENMANNTFWRMAGNLLVAQEKSEGTDKQTGNLKKMYDGVNNQVKMLTKSIETRQKDEHWFMPSDKDLKSDIQTLKGLQDKQKQILQRMDDLNLKGYDAGTTTDGTGEDASGSNDRFEDFDRLFEDSTTE